MVATAKNKHAKIARGHVISPQRPHFIKRFVSRCIAALLSPLDAIGHMIVWNKVKAALGGRQKLIVSGGSALSGNLEDFYETCGVLLVVGYGKQTVLCEYHYCKVLTYVSLHRILGLTECSPLICHRRTDSNLCAGGCVGLPVTGTEIRVVDVDADTDKERPALENGKCGLVLARGPQVMKGYYNNIKATQKSIDSFGWFDTGDLGQF